MEARYKFMLIMAIIMSLSVSVLCIFMIITPGSNLTLNVFLILPAVFCFVNCIIAIFLKDSMAKELLSCSFIGLLYYPIILVIFPFLYNGLMVVMGISMQSNQERINVMSIGSAIIVIGLIVLLILAIRENKK